MELSAGSTTKLSARKSKPTANVSDALAVSLSKLVVSEVADDKDDGDSDSDYNDNSDNDSNEGELLLGNGKPTRVCVLQ